MSAVLLVENEQPRQRLLAWVLEEEGFEVAVADPGGCIDRASPGAVVVLNAAMPAPERRTLVERLHAREARVLELLGDEGEDGATSADAYVAEPYRAAEIVSAIERLRGV